MTQVVSNMMSSRSRSTKSNPDSFWTPWIGEKSVKRRNRKGSDHRLSIVEFLQEKYHKLKDMVVGPGGGAGVGCGAGLGLGLTGGVGAGPWSSDQVKVAVGFGVGCGLGLGIGYGIGIGYGVTVESLSRKNSDSDRGIINL